MTRRRILVVGASGRAAAGSVRRAGYEPHIVDLFADRDTRTLGPTRRAADLEDDLVRIAGAIDCDAWIYAGGLEARPDTVARLAARLPLWGCGADVLRRVIARPTGPTERPPPGCTFPLTLPADAVPPRGRFLRKSCRTSGGLGVEEAAGETAVPPASDSGPAADRYWQQFVAGPTDTALFVGTGGTARLLGTTRQLTGRRWCRARRFHYCGSIGPLPLSGERRAVWEGLGNWAAARFGLIGLFGIDAIRRGERLFPVDVNPRLTASTEVLEAACDRGAFPLHEAACVRGELPRAEPWTARGCRGKAYVFAASQTLVTEELSDRLFALPDAADLPAPGTLAAAGEPLLTLFAEGATPAECLRNLRRRVEGIAAWFPGG